MPPIVFIVLLCSLIFSVTPATAVTWPNIRDGVIHIKTEKPAAITLAWQNSWISESQIDHVFLQKPDGSLQARYILSANNTPGQQNINLEAPGIYRLEVTGASFRNVTITLPSHVQSMFEPVKVHKSVELPGKGQVYFRVPGNRPFIFAARYYENVSAYTLMDNGSGSQYQLKCQSYDQYSRFDSLPLPAQSELTVWQVQWQEKGKAAFWLDGIDNLFAQRIEDFFDIAYPEAVDTIRVHADIVGATPSVGVAFPFVSPPAASWPLISNWQVTAANHYIFTDYYQQQKQGTDFKGFYQKQFSINHDNAIFSLSDRQMVFPSADKAAVSIVNYLASYPPLPNHLTYYAVSDEPNLNYPDYDSFASLFEKIATTVKNHPDSQIQNTQLAIPQSSRFLNGPTRPDAQSRKGIDWAERLIQQYGKYIDAVSWHEWLVRDLIDTSRYQEAVERAYALIDRYRQLFTKEPALIIGQTNISSGPSISPYENETFFAALWWTSVVIQSSLPGKLQQINWFKAADDNLYKKGLVAMNNGQFIEKPVAKAMSFINKNLGKWVVRIENSSPEVDLLASLSEDKKRLVLLGVNKSQRQHSLHLTLPQSCTDADMSFLAESGLSHKKLTGEIPKTLGIDKQTIFSIQCQPNM